MGIPYGKTVRVAQSERSYEIQKQFEENWIIWALPWQILTSNIKFFISTGCYLRSSWDSMSFFYKSNCKSTKANVNDSLFRKVVKKPQTIFLKFSSWLRHLTPKRKIFPNNPQFLKRTIHLFNVSKSCSVFEKVEIIYFQRNFIILAQKTLSDVLHNWLRHFTPNPFPTGKLQEIIGFWKRRNNLVFNAILSFRRKAPYAVLFTIGYLIIVTLETKRFLQEDFFFQK